MIAVVQDNYRPATPRNGVLALSGFGLRIAVERGHLVVEDGFADERRSGRFSRVRGDLRRLVILGHSGTISLDALRWLQDVGCACMHLDGKGTVFASFGTRGINNVRLRRLQARAYEMPVAVEIARALIGAKIAGQASVLERSLDMASAAKILHSALPYVERAESVEHVRFVESRAAAVYWRSWANVPVRFGAKSRNRTPEHWRTFGIRRSVLTERNQRAINPPNAMLNYLNAVGEAEARIALLREGLDSGLGIIHADRPERDNFALDLLEAIRPNIEAHVLGVLRRETFMREDFFETREGSCRLMSPLTERFAQTATTWADLLAPVAKRIARLLERAAAANPRPIVAATQARSRAAVPPEVYRFMSARAQSEGKRDPHWRPPKPRRCRECGSEFKHARNVYCDTCLPLIPTLASARAAEVLRARQAIGQGAVSALTRRKLGRARSERSGQMRVWEAAHPTSPNPHIFVQTIWPHLAGVDPHALRGATGLSISYCRRVLRGQYVPHPMHWDALRKLTSPRR